MRGEKKAPHLFITSRKRLRAGLWVDDSQTLVRNSVSLLSAGVDDVVARPVRSAMAEPKRCSVAVVNEESGGNVVKSLH